MTAPRMVGSIISTEWLARQLGLPVEEVRERINAAERREEEECLVTTDTLITRTW